MRWLQETAALQTWYWFICTTLNPMFSSTFNWVRLELGEKMSLIKDIISGQGQGHHIWLPFRVVLLTWENNTQPYTKGTYYCVCHFCLQWRSQIQSPIPESGRAVTKTITWLLQSIASLYMHLLVLLYLWTLSGCTQESGLLLVLSMARMLVSWATGPLQCPI